MGYHNALLLLLLALSSSSCLCWSLPSEYSITRYDPKDLASEERLLQLFRQWRERHGKRYEHAEEAEKRFESFKRNLKYVIETSSMKSSPLSFTLGLNRFADMSNQEFRETYLSKVKMPVHKDVKKLHRLMGRSGIVSCDAPSSLDWRKKGAVTAVKDQGHCGSCWAFSSTGAMEGINAIPNGELVSLSEQELVDCDSSNDGCEGGYMDYAFEWVINNGGISSEYDYSYTGVNGRCNSTKETSKVVSIDGYEDVDQSDSALLCATLNQPVSVGIDASAMDFQLYTGGIYDGNCSSDPDEINHAVLVVGYGSEGEQDYWIVKNSWGLGWGMEGYFYIKRNTDTEYGVCAINAMASYPTKLSSSPPPEPSPAVPPPSPPPSPPPPTPVNPPPPSPPPPTPATPPPPSPPPPTPATPPPPPSPRPPTPATPPPPSPPPPTPATPPPPPSPPPPPTPITPPPPSPPPPTPVSPPPSPPPPPTPVNPPPPSPPRPVTPSPPPPKPVTPPPSPPPPPPVNPPPPPVIPPLPPHPPHPPPPPEPTKCGQFTYCAPNQSCCCIYQFYNFCLIYGCCEFKDAVCCFGRDYCCPKEFPICTNRGGICLKKPGDYLGIAAREKKMAKHTFPWTKPVYESERTTYDPPQWRRNPFAAAH